MSRQFHIFASKGGSTFELEMPGAASRIKFCSLVEAARHARTRPDGKDATVVIHHDALNRVRTPLFE
jgi:hypothetical protein